MDKIFMKRALELASRGIGLVNPNPLVGAIIVKNGDIIGEGFHKSFGGDHAEIEALDDAKKNKQNTMGSTMYVTLEPCSHYGKTLPCVRAIIESGITKVVLGVLDPNPRVSGRGAQFLVSNGIEVVTNILKDECIKINEVFFKFITTPYPFVTLKYAMTLDGKISTFTGDSRWISNKQSRHLVHELRHSNSAIMVGIGTVLSDDPSLNTRLLREDKRDPIRIVVDSSGKIPLNSKALTIESNAHTIIATTNLIDKDKLDDLESIGATVLICPLLDGRVDLDFLLKHLHTNVVDSILLEGGSELNFNMIRGNLIDKVITFIAPKIIGGKKAKTPIGGNGFELISSAVETNNISYKTIGEDLCIESYILKKKR